MAMTGNQHGWLEHLRACDKSGDALSHYAARNGLRAKSFYGAKTRLMRLGLWPEVNPPLAAVVDEAGQSSRFARVELKAAPPPAPCRVRLVNGVEIELAVTESGWLSLFKAAGAL